MKKLKKDNSGMTLVETTLCFMLLGMLLVAASQVIAACTNVYYETKTNSGGIQASQIVAKEIKGELSDALKLHLAGESSAYAVYSDGASISFIGRGLKQYKFSVDADGDSTALVLRTIEDAYSGYVKNSGESGKYPDGTPVAESCYTVKKYAPEYIGMDYTVKEISFTLFEKKQATQPEAALPIENCPVIELSVTVDNPKFGAYTSTEYIPLYDFCDLTKEEQENLIRVPKKGAGGT